MMELKNVVFIRTSPRLGISEEVKEFAEGGILIDHRQEWEKAVSAKQMCPLFSWVGGSENFMMLLQK